MIALSAPIEADKVEAQLQEVRVAEMPRFLSDAYRQKLGELIELDDAQEKRLKGWLKKRLQEWKSDTTELHTQLEDDNMLVEGVVTETDFPWEGASNVHVPITEMYMEVFTSVEKRSILGADLLWYGDTDVDELKDLLADVEEAMNYKARQEWNIEKCLSQVFWTTNRDGLGAIQCTWAEEYENARDIVLLTNTLDLIGEFPTPDSLGITSEEYQQLASYVEQNASDENPIEVPIQFEKLKYYGCKGEVVELINFVTFPASVPDIKDDACRGYGKRFYERKGSVRKKRDDEVYYEEAANTLIAKSGKITRTSFTQAQDEVEGIKRSNPDEYENFELAIKGRLNGDDDDEGERWFLVTYNMEHDVLLSCMEYPYRTYFYALFKINERPGRLIGRSIPVKTRDLNDEIDTQHNQRINSRTATSVPSFKAQLNSKKDLDPMLSQNKWKPGGIFWLADFNEVDQWKIQPVDQGESLNEEANDMKILDLYLGSAVALLSGSTSPGDPNAPGNKTAIMIQQSNLRMDDPLAELRDGVSELGNICLSHLYQFGPPVIEYQSEMEMQTPNGQAITRTQSKSIHKKYLRTGIHLNMRGITVTQNPDAEMQKKFQLYQMLMSDPMFATDPTKRIELLRDALRAGREPGRNRYLPTPDQVQQQVQQQQQQAAAAAQQQQQAQAAAAADQANKARMDAAKTDLTQKDLAEKTADRALAMNNVDKVAAAEEGAASSAAGAPGGPQQ